MAPFGVAFAVCFVMACTSRDDHPIVTFANSGKDKPAEDCDEVLQPDFSIVFVKDLDSYIEDCSCTGTARGGMARVAAAKRAVNGNYYFIGNTLFPPNLLDSVCKGSLDENQSRQAAFHINSFITAAKALGWARVRLSESERQALSVLGAIEHLHEFMLSGNTLETPYGLIAVNAESISISGTEVSFPPASSRARKVIVAEWWGAQSKGVKPIFSRDLAALAPLFPRSMEARNRGKALLSEVRGNDNCTFVVYSMTLDDALEPVKELETLASEMRFDKMHAGMLPIRTNAFSFTGQEEMLAAWKACAACHKEQYQKWEGSHHAKAYLTLVARGQSKDSRCLACHTSGAESAHDLAVTCASCHMSSGKASCERCHTEITDPRARYAKARLSICGQGKPSVSQTGACGRRAREK